MQKIVIKKIIKYLIGFILATPNDKEISQNKLHQAIQNSNVELVSKLIYSKKFTKSEKDELKNISNEKINDLQLNYKLKNFSAVDIARIGAGSILSISALIALYYNLDRLVGLEPDENGLIIDQNINFPVNKWDLYTNLAVSGLALPCAIMELWRGIKHHENSKKLGDAFIVRSLIDKI